MDGYGITLLIEGKVTLVTYSFVLAVVTTCALFLMLILFGMIVWEICSRKSKVSVVIIAIITGFVLIAKIILERILGQNVMTTIIMMIIISCNMVIRTYPKKKTS